ncbi:hypothetical protein XM38_013780 [Halomicronema hongdechloris C2206]|uniref:Glycosyl transferase family 1 domain-containing protein n=1 Tax=Halomicronema hongdechloris C2206 TaxID=1641165 RepID=A0A1Z3HJE9_9CYAN|nr:glycosyltransferase [Halomicronema hongdechloris]ASC70439.1 hypothetical protein XM38_013780 [Halomicronema hongdechloris C2206]
MKTVALVDANHGRGHHLTYMRFFCRTLLELGYRTLVFYPEPDAVIDWLKIHFPELIENLYVFRIDEYAHRKVPLIGKISSKLQPLVVIARWRYTNRIIKQAVKAVGHEPDLVFFNWLDNYLSYFLSHHLIDLIFPFKWSGIYFRPGDLRFKKRTFLSHYAIARSPRCQALTLLDEEFSRIIEDKLNIPIIPFPDLTDETPPDTALGVIKQIKLQARDRKIIGLIGSLSKRKGLFTFLEAAQRLVEKDYFFVLAGPLNKATFHQEYDQKLSDEFQRLERMIKSPPENCFFYLQSIPDGAEFNAFINIFDILFAAYENFPYSSNILTKAAVFRKPIIVSDGFCMEKRVKRFQFGLSIPEGNVAACVKAIQLLSESSSSDGLSLEFDFEGYKQLHSTKRLGEIFTALLGDHELKTALNASNS